MCETCQCSGNYEPTPRERILIALANPKFRCRSREHLLSVTGLEEEALDELIADCRFVRTTERIAITVPLESEEPAEDTEVEVSADGAEEIPATLSEVASAFSPRDDEDEPADTVAEVATEETPGPPETEDQPDDDVIPVERTRSYSMNYLTVPTNTLAGVVARIISNGGTIYGADDNTLKIIAAIYKLRPRHHTSVHSRKIAEETGLTQRQVIEICTRSKAAWLFSGITKYGNTRPSFRMSQNNSSAASSIRVAAEILNLTV